MKVEQMNKTKYIMEKLYLKGNGVKFFDADGKVYFGQIVSPKDNAKAAKQAKKGMALVQDAVAPRMYNVKADTIAVVQMGKFIPRSFGEDGPWFDDEISKYQHEQYLACKKASDKTNGKLIVGAMFSETVNDGKAYYVVTSVKGSQCLLEHRNFVGDVYMDHYFGWGGWFPVKKIRPYVESEYDLAKLFGSK